MSNNTISNYKKAIKEKYELEKNGDNYLYLVQPSQANLRKLCWQKFENNTNQSDLIVFNGFFGFPFDLANKNLFKTKTDRFRPIGSFFRGETETPTDDIIELAAILVDFQPRPFTKFRVKSSDLIGIVNTEEENKTHESVILNREEASKQNQFKKEVSKPSILFLNFKRSFSQSFFKHSKVILVLVCFLVLGFTISYFLFPKKQCMQWNYDHYEEVSCDNDLQGFKAANVIELLDENVLNLRKIKVSDTTVFFKNGAALIWYAKTKEGIDFFNTHGRHPENYHALKPVTPYIIKKYIKKEKMD
jgi:hypothetical protein